MKKNFQKVKDAEINSKILCKMDFGCHHGLKNSDINYMIKFIKVFIDKL